MKEIKDMLEKMREIIAEQLNCDGETIGLDTSFKDDLGADSLDLFELVMALEEEYGLEIPAEELSDVETVGDIIEYLKTKVWRINSTPFTLNRIRIVSVQNTQQSRTFTIIKQERNIMSTVKTRFAPSPTGRMHVGNLRTALYAYLIAKHEGGKFMLRIEDTDQERFMEGALDIIYRTLAKTGLVHDEGPDKDGGVGPYVQSERQAQGLYMKYAKKLIEQGDAYYCFCDKERLESLKTEVAGKEITVYDKHCLHLSKEEIEANLAAGKPYVIRINMPTEGTTTFHDELYGDITVENNELDDMILIKSDGYRPTTCNVVDDHLMGITHVVRGNEYLSSAPKYNRLYEAFGWEIPKYIHCPLITNEDHQKLSKRCGHSSYEDLLDQGFLTEAIVNFVALLGWSPSSDNEIFSLEELVKEFDYHRISKSPAVFDMVNFVG